jgi:hypothetical protein
MAKKLLLDCDENLWADVVGYKIRNRIRNNNVAVVELIKKGLKNSKNP